MTSSLERETLFSRLQEVLGPEPATTLMTMLPGPEGPATKVDMAELKAEINDFRSELEAEINDLRSELKVEINDLRSELKAEINDLRSELKAEINELRSELVEVKIDVAHLKEDMGEVKTSIRDLQAAVHSYARTFVITQTSTVLAVVGLVLAYDRLF